MTTEPRLLAFTQGDPAGIGPEILLKRLARGADPRFRPVLIAEWAALEALRETLPEAPWAALRLLPAQPDRATLLASDGIPVLDPVGLPRSIEFGAPSAADARGALAALDLGIELASSGVTDALVTAPVAKEPIARFVLPGFVGHTDYLAEKAGLSRYGRDYLMAFLAPGLKVALLSTHVPLRQALDGVTPQAIGEALECLVKHTRAQQAAPLRPAGDERSPSRPTSVSADSSRSPRIAVAGFNPHAGENGLLGAEDAELVAPAVAAARARGLDVHGPESADSLFARARQGEFDWVLALYHDQGLIAVKTAAFGEATNWTVGLPYLRTSVDHGTAYGIAGRGVADERPLAAVVETTLELLAG
ncbi:MAG: 4-hydroxythreonine-4-phosphate dehydrogenase PdxA [Thermoanaerobaculia bacterium]|nr:4-hydroxythreonine-4-phosphate dehydrogenase PdxA [Thermoanaerobaculia bacterium]